MKIFSILLISWFICLPATQLAAQLYKWNEMHFKERVQQLFTLCRSAGQSFGTHFTKITENQFVFFWVLMNLKQIPMGFDDLRDKSLLVFFSLPFNANFSSLTFRSVHSFISIRRVLDAILLQS